jgi:hypothetical protein
MVRAGWARSLILSAALLMSLACSGDWATRHHNDVPWDTTSDPADLDAEVAAGARILRFADGSFVHALHRQYPQSCGPSCLAIMLRSLGFDDPSTPLRLPANVDRLPGSPGATVDVGYVGSMEHLLWLGYHRRRLQEGSQAWNADAPQFMSPAGDLNVELSDGRVATLWPDGVLPAFDFAATGRVPNWLWHGPGNGTGGDDNGCDGLPGVMNYIVAGAWGRGARDARPLTMHSRTDGEVCALRRIIAGFIDHGLPILLGVESGGHFNVIVGYRGEAADASQPFVILTADPLDGWGRPAERLPGRWRHMAVTAENLFDGGKLIYQAVLWNQTLNGGCQPGGWAAEIDRLNGNDWLCGRPVPPTDPLHDPLALRP